MLRVSISRSCITMTGSRIGIVWQFVEMLEEHPEADLAFCGSRQVMLDGVGNRTGEEFDRAISDVFE